ncbi:MAG TPA: hypothetical protein VJV03_18650 [Pyrinomonadaceae bacterium]|nr:hypothetical protein [Pyrinomonadaceae bacterium]
MHRLPRNWNLRLAMISIGVVACLCFSIGEGLRLTPFPVATVDEIEAFNQTDDSLQRYGPLHKPTRTQLPTKRSFVDSAFSPRTRAFEPPQAIGTSFRAVLDVYTIHTGSRPIGRAPPGC